MGIDHGGAHILVSEQLLHRADVISPFEQMSGKAVTQVWQLTGLWILASRTASFTAFCRVPSFI